MNKFQDIKSVEETILIPLTALADFLIIAWTCAIQTKVVTRILISTWYRIWLEKYTSLNQNDHIMICHDMSSNVTMLNWKTFHDIWWHQVYVIKCHYKPGTRHWSRRHLIFRDISWNLMTFGLKIICHDISWHVMIWPLLIQRGSNLGLEEKSKMNLFFCGNAFWNISPPPPWKVFFSKFIISWTRHFKVFSQFPLGPNPDHKWLSPTLTTHDHVHIGQVLSCWSNVSRLRFDQNVSQLTNFGHSWET